MIGTTNNARDSADMTETKKMNTKGLYERIFVIPGGKSVR